MIVTSATIDAEKFSRHFDGAPVIEVSGRLYPVEVRYRPVEGDEEDTTRDEEEAGARRRGRRSSAAAGPGDVLVFLPGEREIREAAEVLAQGAANCATPRSCRCTRACRTPSRTASSGPGGAQRVVLATNVAETSLTVPRIRYVVDTGLARVKRYSYRNKVEMLQVENISQAAAKQRSGRCGRVADGICVRLYSEEDFNARPAFTDPGGAALLARGGDPARAEPEPGQGRGFPVPRSAEPARDRGRLRAAARAGRGGRRKCAHRHSGASSRACRSIRASAACWSRRATEGCLEQMLVIAAALSVQDPRDRPLDKAAAADERHAKFADERSDFLGYLKLWKVVGAGRSSRKAVPRELPLLRAHARVARHPRAAAPVGGGARLEAVERQPGEARRRTGRSTARCSAGCSATSA